MSKPNEPIVAWTAEKLQDLDPDEHDYQEFKSTPYLEAERGVDSLFVERFSKQISAFSNGGGGRIFIGIDDNGQIDGGVNTQLKKGGTRSWLEDVLPDLVSPRLQEINIFEVTRDGPSSPILPGRAVYIVDIPQSTVAPHQARDKRYYLRIAGKSRPMTHVHVMDVMRRTKTPTLTLAQFSPYGKVIIDRHHPNGICKLLAFRLHIVNKGRNLARHVGVEVSVPRPLINRSARLKTLEEDIQYTQRSGDILFFSYQSQPVFPGQECYAMMLWVGIHGNNYRHITNETYLQWRIYADDSIPVEGQIQLISYRSVQKAIQSFKPDKRK